MKATTHRIPWTKTPGTLELLESGVLSEHEPAFDLVGDAAASRGIWSEEGLSLAERWQLFVEGLRGFKRREVLCERRGFWVPLISLRAPVGGGASIECQSSESEATSIGVGVLGASLGSSGQVSIGETIRFAAGSSGRAMLMKVYVTVTQYSTRSGEVANRIDVEGDDEDVETQIANLEEEVTRELNQKALRPRFKVVKVIDLRNAAGDDLVEWTHTASEEAGWTVGLEDGPFASIGFKTNMKFTAKNSGSVKTTYCVPYGRRHEFSYPLGQHPLVPTYRVAG